MAYSISFQSYVFIELAMHSGNLGKYLVNFLKIIYSTMLSNNVPALPPYLDISVFFNEDTELEINIYFCNFSFPFSKLYSFSFNLSGYVLFHYYVEESCQ